MSEHPGDDSQTPDDITIARALEVLQQGAVGAERGVMRFSSNYTFLVNAHFQDVDLMAVYKPQRGERPLWDFPDGTLCKREVATFLTSQTLGWQIVPPTVLRDGPRGLGSIQMFINHDPEFNYFAFDQTMIPQLLHMVAFDFVVNNADRKGGHCIVDESGHLWGIDHGLTFHTDRKLRTVIWDFAGQPIPVSILEDLEALCGALEDRSSDYRTKLAELLDEREVLASQRRIQHLLKTRIYPSPGPGPNYPWPPV